MADHRWSPRCRRPSGLVAPVRLDPTGEVGPTRSQARSSAWRQAAHGWYVPSQVDGSVVEQRILEQGTRLPATGAVTGWASLRWQGATFFDGLADGGRTVLPVPLLPGGLGNLRPGRGATVSRDWMRDWERHDVGGLWCTVPERAVFDEMRRAGRLRPAVLVLDMAAAAGLTTVAGFAAYVERCTARTGVPLARRTLSLASDHCASRPEGSMRLIWVLDAGLPTPLCNRALFSTGGELLGYPDLFDPVAGLVGEYDGADHRSSDRHRRDVAREARYRDHGLEYFTVVGPDLASPDLVVRRMVSARSRAKFLPPESCAWTLDPPPWWQRPLHR